MTSGPGSAEQPPAADEPDDDAHLRELMSKLRADLDRKIDAARTTTPVIEPESVTADPRLEQLTDLIGSINTLPGEGPDASLIDRIAALEHLKASCAAAQAKLAHSFAVQHTAAVLEKITDRKSREYAATRTQKSVGHQIALARKGSPWFGDRLLRAATALNTDLPGTLAALAAGQTTEQRVMDIVTAFGCLTAEDRRKADARIAPALPHLGNQSTGDKARGIAAELDPEAVLKKVRGAVTDRHVSLRPAPDTMTRLSALLPVGMGVAVRAELEKAAAAAMSAPGGESRGRGQIMADELVNRITGTITGCDQYGVPIYNSTDHDGAADRPADVGAGTVVDADVNADNGFTDTDTDVNADSGFSEADADDGLTDVDIDIDLADRGDDEDATADIRTSGSPSTCHCTHASDQPAERKPSNIQLRIVMTDRAFFGDDNEPAHLHGYGKIPAPIARAMRARQADRKTEIWIKRLYTDPTNQQLLAMDSRARLFPAGIADFILNRDQICRTPWCDAPIRQIDHIRRHADGGPTNIHNAQGLCQACNLAKETPGWTSITDPDGSITTTTPTGHTYNSPPPQPPASGPWPQRTLPHGWVEIVGLGEQRYHRVA